MKTKFNETISEHIPKAVEVLKNIKQYDEEEEWPTFKGFLVTSGYGKIAMNKLIAHAQGSKDGKRDAILAVSYLDAYKLALEARMEKMLLSGEWSSPRNIEFLLKASSPEQYGVKVKTSRESVSNMTLSDLEDKSGYLLNDPNEKDAD